MIGFLRAHWITLAMTAVIAVAALIYGLSTAKVFRVKGAVVVFRSQIANPELVPEEVKNRWVWVRDGLATREGMLSDDIVIKLIEADATLKERMNLFGARIRSAAGDKKFEDADIVLQYARELKKTIELEYTGGDVYSFIISVTDRDAHLAKRMVTFIIQHFLDLAVNKTIRSYQKAMNALAERVKTLESNRQQLSNPKATGSPAVQDRLQSVDGELTYLRDTFHKLNVAKLIFAAEADERVKIIEKPYVPAAAVWPQLQLLLVVGLFLGFVGGLVVEFIVHHAKTRGSSRP